MVRGMMVARGEFLNPSGTVQGGILTSMLDNVLGLAIIATLGAGQLAPTLELKANFIRPGKLGSYIGEGRIVSRGTGVCFLDAKLNDADGNLIATATSTARILSPR